MKDSSEAVFAELFELSTLRDSTISVWLDRGPHVRMKWRTLISAMFVVLCALNGQAASAEDGFAEFRTAHQDFLRLLTGEGKDIEMRYLLEPKSESESEEGRFALHDILASAELPLPVGRDFFFRIAPEYEAKFYNFSDVEILGVKPQYVTLYKMMLGVGFGEFIGDRTLVTGKFTPGILSDLDDGLDHNQMEYFGQLIAAHQVSDNVQLLLGAVSDQLFEGTSVYPVAAVRFQSPDRRWHIKFTPPIDARVGYEVNTQNQIYLKFWQTGDRYRVFFKEADARFDLRVEERRIGAGLLHHLDDHFNFSFEFGTTLLSRFEFDVESPEIPDEDANPAFYSFLSVGYAL